MASWRAAMTARLARSVNRENLTGSGGKAPESRSPKSEALGTNRFCAACLVTPMDWPISVHDAPVIAGRTIHRVGFDRLLQNRLGLVVFFIRDQIIRLISLSAGEFRVA